MKMEEARHFKLDSIAGRSFRTRVVGSALELHVNQKSKLSPVVVPTAHLG